MKMKRRAKAAPAPTDNDNRPTQHVHVKMGNSPAAKMTQKSEGGNNESRKESSDNERTNRAAQTEKSKRETVPYHERPTKPSVNQYARAKEMEKMANTDAAEREGDPAKSQKTTKSKKRSSEDASARRNVPESVEMTMEQTTMV
jgi:hypothetical protein